MRNEGLEFGVFRDAGDFPVVEDGVNVGHERVAVQSMRVPISNLRFPSRFYLNKGTRLPTFFDRLRRLDDQERAELLEIVKSGSVTAWRHVYFNGFYDFSDDSLRDSFEVLRSQNYGLDRE